MEEENITEEQAAATTSDQSPPTEECNQTSNHSYRQLTIGERLVLIIGILIALAFSVLALKSMHKDERGVSGFFDELDPDGSNVNGILSGQ